MNPLQQQELMEKLNKQNHQAGYDTTTIIAPTVQPTTLPSVQAMEIPVQPVQTVQVPQPPHPMQVPQPEIEVEREEQRLPVHPEQPMQMEPAQSVYQEEASNESENRSARIAALEQALGEEPKDTKSMTAKARVFLDDFGSETYYVKNISNGHVAVSDIDVTIKRGKCEDLLRYATLEDIKKSRDLRASIEYDKIPSSYRKSLLLRLTPEEYEVEKTKELKNKQKISQFKQNQTVAHSQYQQQQQQQQTQTYNAVTQQQIAQPQTPRIRPTVLSKLEKLRLSTVPENAHLGLAPEEFVEWAVTENLSIEEMDFVISHPNVINNPNIRTALYEKRSEMV